MSGRPLSGTEHVERLEGDRLARERLKAILETLGGSLSVEEAARRLGVCESRFHELRAAALRGALGSLAPRPLGRPAAPRADTERIAELERALLERDLEIEALRVREELLLVMPEVLSRGASRPRPRAEKGGAIRRGERRAGGGR